MTIIDNSVVTLTSGRAGCAIVPGAGGAVAGFWWEQDGERVDWLRPAGAAAVAGGNVEQMACFPLVPYGSRIREGRFRFGGREVVETPPAPETRHAVNGHGWRRDWRVSERGADRLVLEYEHGPAAPGPGPIARGRRWR